MFRLVIEFGMRTTIFAVRVLHLGAPPSLWQETLTVRPIFPMRVMPLVPILNGLAP